MSDIDAGKIIAEATIEYKPGGLDKMKDDLKSLPDMLGGLEEGASGASDGLAGLDKQMGSNAESAGSFSEAIEKLPKMIEGSTEAASEMTGVLSESQQAFRDTGSAVEEMQKPLAETTSLLEDISPPMQAITKQAGSMNDSFAQVGDTLSQSSDSWGTAGQNIQAFQEALASPDSFQMIDEHMNKTGQSVEQFTSSIGESNAGLFHQMSMDWSETNAMFDTASLNFADIGKSANAGFGGVAASAADADKAVSEFMGTTSKSAKAMEPVSFGSAFGEAFSGITGFLSDIAMPLMAVQMIGMAVGAAGQAIYDAAAVAEGPAAHSFGTFTGTVDALGQSAQKAGAAFSEGFGQQVIPTLNALNYQASNGDLGGIGGFVGGIASTIANLTMITTGVNIIGGLQGLANQGAALLGMQQPYQGPPPEQQAQITYQQQMANMPQTVVQQTYQNRTQTAMNLADAISPAFLQSQDDLQASQQIYQRLQQSYNISHPVNQAQMIQQAQYDQYVATQGPIIAAAQANAQPAPIGLDTFTGYWGGAGQNVLATLSPAYGLVKALSGGGGPYGDMVGGIGNIFGGMGGGIGNIFGGIGNWFQDLFSGGQQDAPPVGIPGSGGCFVAGTRVLMGNGQERAIETLHVGEEVQSHDGTGHITDCIIFPAKQTYKLVFSDGTILFTTDSHPLASTNGWKSIDPKSTYRENPALPVTPLSIGDLIYTVDGSTCRLLSLQKHEIVQVYNITVDTSHTYYANNILVHNAKLGGGGAGVGTEQVSLSHTFTANVTWEAQNLQKSFTASAQWASQNLTKAVTAAAQWATQNLSKAVTAVANWAEQGVMHAVTAVANWAEQNVMHAVTAAAQWTEENVIHPVVAAAQWVDQNLIHPVVAAAQWAEEGLTHIFRGVASWIGEGLTHTFDAVANWTAQNLTPNFTVNPSFTMLAEGTTNWPGGPAIVGEGGSPEVVEHNGQYTMFDQGATLVDLPSGANVYPMQNLTSYSSPSQFADGTGGGGMIPISFGGGSNASQPMIINLNIDGQTFWSSAGTSLAQSARAGSGMRSY